MKTFGWPIDLAKATGPEPMPPAPRAQANLEEVLAAACEGLGITPAQFRSLLSPEDLADIEAGDIDSRTLHAYGLAFAEGMGSGRIVVPGGEL